MKVSTLAQQKAAGRGSREQGSGVDYDGDLAYRRPDGNNRCLAGVELK
jgi:hypothetical protein